MKFLNKINKFNRLIKNKIWRKGLLNNIAASIELENLIKDLPNENFIYLGDLAYLPYGDKSNQSIIDIAVIRF